MGGAAAPVLGAELPMATSSKIMMVLAFVSVLTIIIIALFVMNIVWSPSNKAGGEGEDPPDTKKDEPSNMSNFRNYIGAGTSSFLLLGLLSGFYFTSTL